MVKRLARLLIVCLICLLGIGLVVNAQFELVYSDRILGEITDAPVSYTFSGTEGDWVAVRVISLTADVTPSVALTSSTGEQLTFSEGSQDSISGIAQLNYLLGASDSYTIQVSADQATGYLLILDGHTSDNITSLTDTSTSISTTPNTAQLFAIIANPDAPITFSVDGDGIYTIEVYSWSGELIAVVNSTVLSDGTLNLPASGGQYILSVKAREASDLTLNISDVIVPDEGGDDTSETTDTTAPTDSCTVTAEAGSGINIRSGDSTAFDAFSTLTSDLNLPVTGITASNWYQIDVDGRTGYVFADVVIANGPCDDLPAVVGPPPPATAVPTVAPTDVPQAPPPPPPPPPPQTTEEP